MAATAVGLLTEPAPDPVVARHRRIVAVRQRKWRAKRRELGHPLLVDPGPALEVIVRLRRRGWTYTDIAAGVGMTVHNLGTFRRLNQGGGRLMLYTTRQRFEELWAQATTVLSLSPEPLLAYVRARYGDLKGSGYRTQLSRLQRQWDRDGKGLTRDQAERWARRFGKLEWELWPELAP